jgi:hypothetical protein
MSVQREPVILAQAVAELVEQSNLLDLTLKLRLAAWRDGYRAAAAQFEACYERGYTDAQLDYKAIHHGVIHDLRQHLRTWDGLRTHFGDPRPGDYPGQDGAA